MLQGYPISWKTGAALLGAALLAISAGGALAQEAVRLQFKDIEIGAKSDPTGLWSDEEVAEASEFAGPNPQPLISYAQVPVDGGTLTVSIIRGGFCGMADCQAKFMIQTDSGEAYRSQGESVCQSWNVDGEEFTVDPVALELHACSMSFNLAEMVR